MFIPNPLLAWEFSPNIQFWGIWSKIWGRNGVPSRWFHKGRPLAVSDSHHQWTHLSLVATGRSGQFWSVIKCSVLVCYFYAKCFIVVLLMCLLFATGVLGVWIGSRINRVVLDIGCVDIGIDIVDKRWQCHILVLSSFIQFGNATCGEVLMLNMMLVVFPHICSSFIIFLHVFIFAILVLCWYCLPSTLMAFLRGGGACNRSSNLGETPHIGPA